MVLEDLPDWERLLAAERHLQALVPGSVLVEVLANLESAAGWQTSRVQRPVLILGHLDGVMTGIRQLRRTRPLETEVVAGLTVPTLAEMARIKGWLLATRHTMRDYLDAVVLLERLGPEAAPAAAAPVDAAAVDLATYKGLMPPWNDWAHVAGRGRHWASALAAAQLAGGAP